MTELLIPKIFHVIWLGDKPMSDDHVEYSKSWLHYHLDWEMKLWNSENMINLQNQQFYDKSTIYAQKADIARYEIIYNFGGVYIDSDFECLKNIEELLVNTAAFSSYSSKDFIENAIMGCTPNHPAFKMLIDCIPKSIAKYKMSSIIYQTGPMYVTKILRNRKDITIFSPELFYTYQSKEKHVNNNTYAIHHCANSWIK